MNRPTSKIILLAAIVLSCIFAIGFSIYSLCYIVVNAEVQTPYVVNKNVQVKLDNISSNLPVSLKKHSVAEIKVSKFVDDNISKVDIVPNVNSIIRVKMNLPDVVDDSGLILTTCYNKYKEPDTTKEENITYTYTPPVNEYSSTLVYGKYSIAPPVTELEMLACVIYQEAGADYICDTCRKMVADIVLNRVASENYPNTIYDVLTARAQYGRFYYTGIVWPKGADSSCNAHAIERAYRIAEEILNGQHSYVYGKDFYGQAERKVFETYYSGGEYIYCCGIYFW